MPARSVGRQAFQVFPGLSSAAVNGCLNGLRESEALVACLILRQRTPLLPRSLGVGLSDCHGLMVPTVAEQDATSSQTSLFGWLWRPAVVPEQSKSIALHSRVEKYHNLAVPRMGPLFALVTYSNCWC
jgi:hypothetical protein